MKKQLPVVGLMALLMALCVSGCTQVRNSLHSALEDATDIVRLDVSGSFGTDMGAHVMLTKLAQLKSYSYEDLYRVGFDARHIGVWQEDREDWWLGVLHGRKMHVKKKPISGIHSASIVARMRGSKKGIFQFLMESDDEIGVGAHLFVGGFRIGIRPVELLDFFTNLVGIDLCNDNLTWPERQLLYAAGKAAEDAAAEPAEAE